MNSLFCRHNRFTAECPICAKNSVLSSEAPERVKPVKPAPKRSRSGAKRPSAATVTRYPHVSTEPLDRAGRIYEVRLDKVPGGLRLGEWRNGELERHGPVLPASALRGLFDDARGRGLVAFDLPEPVDTVAEGMSASPGQSGDMKEELRLERLDEPGLVRVARWVFWPGGGVGWELQEAPVMLPEARFAAVLGDAAALGLI
ncbi:MAG: hypothetical protein QOH13_416 [Thermoleophilaceae bacterium]|jgi:hypothetical protein|nr:hypothetical protein [Thermoleophilaceae bacterium]